MKRVIAVATAFLMLGSSVAFARDYHGGDRNHRVAEYSYHRHDNNAGAAIAAGILGLGLGMLAASQAPAYYAPPYAAQVVPPYGYGYAPAYGYGYAPAPYGYAAPGVSVGLHF